MKFLLRFFKILAVICFFCNNITFSQEKKSFSIGVENITYNPYYYSDSKGNYLGFSRDLFDLFAKNNNFRIEFQPMPVARLLNEFFNGKIDLKFPDSAEWLIDKRVNKQIIYSDNIVEYIDGIIVKIENKNKDFSFLKTLGTIRGFDLSEYKSKSIHIVECSNIPELIDKLYNNNVDGIFFNVSAAMYYINNDIQYKNKFYFKRDFSYHRDFYKMSTMKNKYFIDKLNIFLRVHKKEINELKKKNKIIF